ncbi:MAG: enoyl-CoA hydratase/isomerase family protein [Pseudomonadota bacterium]
MFIFDSIEASAGRVARISLDKPASRNSIAIGQWSELADAAERAAASGARVLIIRSGAPNIFSSGADLGDLEGLATDPALRGRFRIDMARAFDTIAGLPIATIAAVDGGCYGAGVALAMACDIRVAGDKAQFAITPAKVGIVYPAGDVARLRALVGPGQAARLLTTGMTISADEALAIGLVEERAGSADTAALALAERIAANARSSVAGLKRILAQDDAADQLFEDAFGGEDFREGLAAFRGRRKPVFAA